MMTCKKCKKEIVKETVILNPGMRRQKVLRFRYCPTQDDEHTYQMKSLSTGIWTETPSFKRDDDDKEKQLYPKF